MLIKILYFYADNGENTVVGHSMAMYTQQQENTAVGHVEELNMLHMYSYTHFMKNDNCVI